MSMKKTHYILIGDYGCNEKTIKNAHMKAKNFFNSKVNLISSIQKTNPLGYFFFIKCADSSKHWCKKSDYMQARTNLLLYLIENEIMFLELSEEKLSGLLQKSKNGREFARPLFLI
ncbi:TPA: hypothetical protein QCU53_006018 [Bacillus thuringiensis]|uniref:hypothetical protein n=1 Tax=Bacillus cereus group TaxID=86661 RepID=UPI001F5957F0|nr:MULTISPECIES: hypothetical protein [Bacillus cereus group]MCU5209301.1 hypothetical protein [Bacillus paranthracis]HDR6319072.1 hypothetical protein [Bacillus thuringiensis]